MAKLTVVDKPTDSCKWYGYFYYYDKEKNKKVPKWVSSGLHGKGLKTKATEICKQKMDEFLAQIEHLTNVKDKTLLDYTLWEYIDRYIESRDIRDNTIDGYTSIKNVVKDYFQDKPIKDFVKEDITKFFKHLRNLGKTENTILHYYRLLSPTFALAIEDNVYIKPNPMTKSKKKSDAMNIEVIQEEIEYLEPKDQQRLYEILKGTKLELPYLLAVYFGLRRGEMCALEISDFDYIKNELIISKSLYYKNANRKAMHDPKNKKTRRLVFIDSVIKKLNQYIKTRQEQKEKWDKGKEQFDIEYRQRKKKGIFAFDPLLRHENGDMLTPSYISHEFDKKLTKNNFEPHIHWHSLRHTCASNLRKSGAKLEDLKDYLGHQSINTTIKYYSHLYEEDKEEKAKAYGVCVDGILKIEDAK